MLFDIDFLVQPLLNQKAWGAELGVGSFLTIEFGKEKLPLDEGETKHGEWHLWIYSCAWRLERNSLFLTSSEDSRDNISTIIPVINGLTLEEFEVDQISFDAKMVFSDGIQLKLFSIIPEDEEHWMLFTPEDKVFVAGPGNQNSFEES